MSKVTTSVTRKLPLVLQKQEVLCHLVSRSDGGSITMQYLVIVTRKIDSAPRKVGRTDIMLIGNYTAAVKCCLEEFRVSIKDALRMINGMTG